MGRRELGAEIDGPNQLEREGGQCTATLQVTTHNNHNKHTHYGASMSGTVIIYDWIPEIFSSIINISEKCFKYIY